MLHCRRPLRKRRQPGRRPAAGPPVRACVLRACVRGMARRPYLQAPNGTLGEGDVVHNDLYWAADLLVWPESRTPFCPPPILLLLQPRFTQLRLPHAAA